MKPIILATVLVLLAGCAGFPQADGASSGATAGDDSSLPLYLQNPANCAEAGLYCRRR